MADPILKTLHPVLVSIPATAPAKTAACVAQQRRYSAEALRASARHSGAPESGYQKDSDNVPQPNEGWCWSVAHKRGWAAAVVSGSPVGIDVERIARRGPDFLDETASPEEWALAGDRCMRTFFRIWTAKEATLKANGVGIGKLLDCRLTALLGPASMNLHYAGVVWHVTHWCIDDYVAAVSSPTAASIAWHVDQSESLT
ncbi:MAG: 4'-phosphopantetheinyl transferase family protein [Phycisphaerae bacterium]